MGALTMDRWLTTFLGAAGLLCLIVLGLMLLDYFDKKWLIDQRVSVLSQYIEMQNMQMARCREERR